MKDLLLLGKVIVLKGLHFISEVEWAGWHLQAFFKAILSHFVVSRFVSMLLMLN